MNSSHSSSDNNSSGSQLINTQNFEIIAQSQFISNRAMHQYNKLKLTLENLRNLENIEFQETLKPGDNSQSNNLISQIRQFLKQSIKSNIKDQNKFINKYNENSFLESIIECVFKTKKKSINKISIDELLKQQEDNLIEQLLKRLLQDFAQAAFYLENLIESYFQQKNQFTEQLNQKDQQKNQLNKQNEQLKNQLQQQYQNVDEFEKELNKFQSYYEALNKDYQQSQRKIKSLSNELKELQDEYSSLVLNCRQTIEHNQNLINENNNLRSQKLALQVQFAQEKYLQIENFKFVNINEKFETKRDNLNQAAIPCGNSSELVIQQYQMK